MKPREPSDYMLQSEVQSKNQTSSTSVCKVKLSVYLGSAVHNDISDEEYGATITRTVTAKECERRIRSDRLQWL